MNFLYSRDSKGKIRILQLSLEKDKDDDLDSVFYTIKRKSGLLNGKLTIQPDKVITKGKVKRTIEEQALLEYNSIISKQKDKGYIIDSDLEIPKGLHTDYTFIDVILPKEKTDATGNRKVMLAKDPKAKPVKDEKFFNGKEWYISRKLDGEFTLSLNSVNSVNPVMGIPSQF